MAPSRQLRPKPLFDEPSLRTFLFNHGVKDVHMGKIWKYMLAKSNKPVGPNPADPREDPATLERRICFLHIYLGEKHQV